MDLEVSTTDLTAIRAVEQPVPEPADGQALLAIDTFGLSTNNVTFAVTGDLLGYWKLFPASAPGWGRVPVFGFAEVVASRHPGVAEGTRVFGYLPMSDLLLVEPARVDERGFLDGAEHRRDVMATVWNHYQRVAPGGPRADAVRSLLRPLFVTGFLIEDFIEDQGCFGADVLVITSASAKTAIATAYQARKRGSMLQAGAHLARVRRDRGRPRRLRRGASAMPRWARCEHRAVLGTSRGGSMRARRARPLRRRARPPG
ncbi:MAG: DUF2855 family protein [Acidimicrobiales bacterium]